MTTASDFLQDQVAAKFQFGKNCWEASQEIEAKHVMFIKYRERERENMGKESFIVIPVFIIMY